MKEGCVVKSAEAGPAEMEKINRYTRREYAPEEVYSFSLALCDNEVDRDLERFSGEALEKLRELFLGKTCIFDHERRSANQTARIYDTWLERDTGRRTRAGEEYVRLMAKAYLPRTEESRGVVERIESGILKEVSVSCSVKRSVCGVCGQEQCRHVQGKDYGGMVGHRVLMEPADAYECSFVAVPAQRGAGVTKSFGKERGPLELEKLLRESGAEGVELSKAQAEELARRMEELREKAGWGEQYREALSADILKYSVLIQPELPAAVLKSALSGLSLSELSVMGKTYERMAQDRLPLKPQLAPEGAGQAAGGSGEACGNREFRI